MVSGSSQSKNPRAQAGFARWGKEQPVLWILICRALVVQRRNSYILRLASALIFFQLLFFSFGKRKKAVMPIIAALSVQNFGGGARKETSNFSFLIFF